MAGTCAFLTMTDLSEFVTDDELAVEPLARRGWRVEFVPWRDPGVDWNRFDAVLVRSPWDYQKYPQEFQRTLATIDQSRARLANDLATMRWNLSKRYLRDLDYHDVPIPPTLWRHGIAADDIPGLFTELGSEEIVIKPEVGAGAADTYWLTLPQAIEKADELANTFVNRDCMVQPFLPAVVSEGEFSLILFNGKLSHAILKTPKPQDFRVQEEHGSTIVPVEAEPGLIAAADLAMKPIATAPLYARVDFVRHEGQFLLMELELIEPSLYLRMDAGAPERFAEAFEEWMADGKFE